jgi:3-hydroxyisobutyrate dehydrogenase
VSTEPFGFVGLGAMGGPMIEKAIEAGLTVHVFDTNQAALDSAAKLGAKIEKSAAGVASAVEVVFVSLPNAPIVEAVALGPDESSKERASSTTSIFRRPARRSP